MAKSKTNKEHPGAADEHRRGRSVTPYSSAGSLGRSSGWPLGRLRSEFDRVFEDFFRGWGGLPAWSQQQEPGWGLDVEDQEDKIVVRAEAPGFEPDDFDLQVRDDQLVLCACQSEEKEQEGGRQWHQQKLYRSIPLSSNIDAEHVDAQYRNGILTVTLPKTEEGKSRRIEVKS
jgi:HSP20 family protein